MADTAIHQKIDEIVKSDKVVLFMKGNRNFPQCGFSATVVQILGGLTDDYTTVNVLEDPDIRQGVKDYAQWPTIPQLYIDGEFVGGCDIVKAMSANGDLHKALGVKDEPVDPPTVTITDAAATELKAALAECAPDDRVHISVNMGYQHEMSVGPLEPGQLATEANGVPLCFDKGSARRANGLVVDYRTENGESGFKLDNPNAK